MRQFSREEFARLRGVDPDSITRGVERGTYPPPDGHIARSPWWWESTIEAWEPPRPGRPRKETA